MSRHTPGWLLTTVAATLVGCSSPAGSASRPSPVAEQPLPASLADVARDYGITIEPLKDHLEWNYWFHDDYIAEPPTPEQVQGCAKILATQIRRYPRPFFERIRLRKVILCGSILIGKGTFDGFAETTSDAIYLNAADLGNECDASRGHTLHHELYHILDARDDQGRDADWAALNPKGFHYGRGTKQDMCPCSGWKGDGFLNGYGKGDIREDKADYFASMIMAYAALRDLAERDPRVRAKADLMEKMTADFCPAIDAAFWAAARQRSESAEDRLVASVRYEWMDVAPGIDPLHPERQGSEPFAIVRRTRFPGCSNSSWAKGRVTQLDEDCLMFIQRAYSLAPSRCILLLPEDLKKSRFDLIVRLPDTENEYDPRVWSRARAAFESEFGVTAREETRELDAYAVTLGPGGRQLLKRAALRNKSERSAGKAIHLLTQRSASTRPAGQGSEYTARAGFDIRGNRPRFVVENLSLAECLSTLEMNHLDRPVVDETGFNELISLDLPYEPDARKMLQSLAETLGLHVQTAKRSLKVTVFQSNRPEGT